MEKKFKSSDVVWIGQSGFDRGGSGTLGILFNKILDISTLFQSETEEIEGITIWRDLDELDKQLEKLSPKVIIVFPHLLNKNLKSKKLRLFFDTVFKYQAKGAKIILPDCGRNGTILGNNDSKETMKEFKEETCPYTFDEMWAITPNTRDKWKNLYHIHKVIDLNIYEVNKEIISNRERTIGYVSRLNGIKGTGRLIKAIENHCNKKDNKLEFPYIHLGSSHDIKRWEEKGWVAGSIIAIQMLAHSMKDKTPRNAFSIKSHLEEELDLNKYNIYPRYSYNDIPKVISRVGIAICPTLARMEPLKQNSNQLFQTKPKDKDSKYIEKNKNMWVEALEYANCELIDYGVPVMFSKDYALTYDPDMIKEFPELIYDNLEDCLNYVENNYDMLLTIAPKQREWLVKKTENIKQNIIKELNNLI